PLREFQRLLATLGFGLVSATMIVTGLASIRSHGNRAGLLLLLGGLAICIVQGTITALDSGMRVKSLEQLGSAMHQGAMTNEQWKEILARPGLTSELLSKLSRIHAHERYVETGEQVDYLTPAGETARFQPTGEEMEFRIGRVALPGLLADARAHRWDG